MSLVDNFKKFVSEISERYKYARGNKGKLENKYKQLKDWKPIDNLGKTGRLAGLAGVDILWGLWCLLKFTAKDTKAVGNKIFVDNALIDKLETKKYNLEVKDKDLKFVQYFKSLQKSNPRMAAKLHLWMLYALTGLLITGGIKIVKNKENIKETVKEWEEDKEVEEEIDEETQHCFSAYKEKLQPITPWLISELILCEGTNTRDGKHVPYKDSRGIWTIGFGSTVLKDGSRVTANTPPITNEEAYDLACWHLEDHETFFLLYCYGVANPSLKVRNTGEAFGLCSNIYNAGTNCIENPNDRNHKERFTILREEYKKYGAAIQDSVVAEIFNKYPVTSKTSFGNAWMETHDMQNMADSLGNFMRGGNGMHWRRWLEAGLITGDINPKDLLECPEKGLSDFYHYIEVVSDRNGVLALWDKTENGYTPRKSTYTEFKNWLENPLMWDKKTEKILPIKRKKVKDVLPSEILQECERGQCEIGVRVQKQKQQTEIVDNKTYTIGYEDYYKSAIASYKQGDYEIALTTLDSLISVYPNNALLHNDMALIYNKMGKYDKALEHARIILHDIGDKSQYGAAQYNAGVAYENKGDLQKSLQNYKLSLSNGNNDAREAIKRVQKKIKQQQTKAVAFNDGILKLKEKQNQQHGFIEYPNNDYTA